MNEAAKYATICLQLLGSGLLVATIACCFSGSEGEQRTLFQLVPPAESGLEFSNTLTETERLNIHEYLYAYNGGGVAIGDFDNDGLPEVFLTANQTENRLYHNEGELRFADITESAGVAGDVGETAWTTGVSVADVNNDGFLDLYVSQVSDYGTFTSRNRLYINNGDLTFSERSEEFGLDLGGYCQQAAFFDYDGDGDLDLFQLRHSVHNPDVYLRAELRSNRDSLAGDLLLRNDEGSFNDVSNSAGIYGGATGYGLAVGLSDLDGDGCPDIYVSNDFHENDYVYYNNCDGTFREDIRGTLGHSSTFSMGNDIADIDNDGRPDVLTLDMKPEPEILRKQLAGPDPYTIYNYKLSFGYFYQFPRNMLQLNRGNLFGNNVQFSEVGEYAGVSATDWSWGGLLADLDNDGWKDIFITNGIPRRPIDQDYINYTYDQQHRSDSALELVGRMPDGAAANRAFRNEGDLRFTDRSAEWGLDLSGYSNGAACGDLDGDGDLDLVVNNLTAPATLYRNTASESADNHFLRVKLEGDNRAACCIGARVIVEVAGRTFQQERFPVRGWLSSSDADLVFGLGSADRVQALTVRWPSGSVSSIRDLGVDTTVVLRSGVTRPPAGVQEREAPRFIDITESSGLSYTHTENNFLDFATEGLLPHMLSTEGPKLAAGDINGDGLTDLVLGGAHGQATSVFVGSATDYERNKFVRSPQKAFSGEKGLEDAGLCLVDVDLDGDLDLYVVSGGGQPMTPDYFQDRLYRNDGRGKFTKMEAALPRIESNGSCVVSGDFNGDGYPDLFVGGRSVPGAYGTAPRSHVLINDGEGGFRSLTGSGARALRELGMVTDAAWLPEESRLVVVGEWMPVTLLTFRQGVMGLDTVAGTAGWWNTVHAADLDGDGHTDLVAGNLGYNSTLVRDAGERMDLYVKDFDQNLSTDPLLTYRREGREWLFTDLNQLKKQMPGLGRRFPTYASYSGLQFSEVLHAGELSGSRHLRAEVLASGCLMNLGGGDFEFRELPPAAQFAPVHAVATADVDGDGIPDLLTAGNFAGFVPSIGRMDASYGNYLRGNGDGTFTAQDAEATGFAVYGEVRDILVLPRRSGGGDVVLLRNNAPARVLGYQSATGALQ